MKYSLQLESSSILDNYSPIVHTFFKYDIYQR